MLLALIGTLLACLFGYLILSKSALRHRGLLEACSVSRAHLTCDSGSTTDGYNSVVAVMIFTGLVAFPVFQSQFISSIVSREDVFRRRMVFKRGCMYWETVGSEWKPADHINIHTDIVHESELSEVASKLLSTPIELTRPCWSVLFVENVILGATNERASAVLFRYHHSLADGFTMIQKMISRIRPMDGSRDMTKVFPMPRESMPVPRGLSAFRSFIKGVVEILKLKPDVPGIFRASTARRAGEKLSVAFSGILSLAEVKQIAHAASDHLSTGRISVNDVITAIVSRAFRAHHMRKSLCAPQDITTVVWVSLKKAFDFATPATTEWDNDSLGFAYCQLPLSAESATECLTLCHDRLSALKSSAEPVVINSALKLIGSLPVSIGKAISAVTADIASVSMSNLPGPSCPVYWPVSEGEDVSKSGLIGSVYFATSPPFHFGPLVSVISYCGTFFVSLSAREELLSQSDLEWIATTGIRQAADEFTASYS